MPKLPNETVNIFKREFNRLLTQSERPPFLFIGSGISIRYCRIPTWLNLLKGFVEKHKDCFEYEFGYYSSKCSNDPLKIASNLAEEFHEHWWKSSKFSQNRIIYQDISGRDTEVAFKIELAEFVKEFQENREELSEEITLMTKAVISGILTTNWDDFLQKSFVDFQVQIGQREAIFADQRSIGELYKIHGCSNKPESLIVTSKDYDQFINSNYYLNAKLLTFFAEYPIIFIGYSLSDKNIELILKNLISCLDKELFQVEKLQNRLFFVEWVNNHCEPSLEPTTYTLSSISIPLIKIKINEFTPIWDVLAQFPRTLPIKILRQLQGMIFDFVTTNKSTGKILVNGIEELDSIENLEVVFGFGNISKLQDKGVLGLNAKDLLQDILFEHISPSNYSEIVEKLLSSVIRQNVFVPFFKYQVATENLNTDNSLKSHSNDNYTLNRTHAISMEDYRVESTKTRNLKLIKKYTSLENLLKNTTKIHAFQLIPFLEKSQIDVGILSEFLKQNWEEFGSKDHAYSSTYRKCICLLDYLKFANH